MENWKTVISFTQPHEAHLAKSVLESEGIETMLQDEYTAQIYNFSSNAIGGVKIQIKDTDFENGLALLQKGGFITENESSEKKNIELVEFAKGLNIKICPFCKSDNIGRKNEVNILTVILYYCLGAIFPIFKRTYKCFDCEKEWKFIKDKK